MTDEILDGDGQRFTLVAAEGGPTVVPEPSTLLLLSSGLAILGFAWRKKRQQS